MKNRKKFLSHPSHGVCRVISFRKHATNGELEYTLTPVSDNRGKIRFTIPESALAQSGFNDLPAAESLEQILDFFQTGKCKQDGEAFWKKAVCIREGARNPELIKGAKTRHDLEMAIASICRDFSFTSDFSAKEIAEKIRTQLNEAGEINPLISNMLMKMEAAEGSVYKRTF